jgi:hypothetical protein
MNAAQQRLPIGESAFNALNRRRRALVAKIARLSGVPVDEIETWCKRELIVPATAGSDSSKALDDFGWRLVMNRLEAEISKWTRLAPAADRRTPGGAVIRDRSRIDRDALPTGAQKRVIDALRAALGWDETQLAAWCRAAHGFDRPATRGRAGALIESLKSKALRELRLAVRGAAIVDQLTGRERDVVCELLDHAAGRGPNRLSVGAVLWTADLCRRHGG